MSHYKKHYSWQYRIEKLFFTYIPNRHDNLKQLFFKSLFLLACIGVLASAFLVGKHFLSEKYEQAVIENSRKIWYKTPIEDFVEELEEKGNKFDPRRRIKKELLRQNDDFVGWIVLDGTQLDNPVYKAKNNTFYLTHNSLGKKSSIGTVFMDADNTFTKKKVDKNLVLFGKNAESGAIFGELEKFRSLSFYKENPTINFTSLYSDGIYKIYAVFILNAKAEDDAGVVYNIYNQPDNAESFEDWYLEATQRSLINTTVDVSLDDEFLTLVTNTEDFENSRLVVMARKTRAGEDSLVDTQDAVLNPTPKYPKKWYSSRGIKYPF